MNYFPFIDFVALQSHIYSLTFCTFWALHGESCQHGGCLRDIKGQTFSPEKAPAGPQANRCVAHRLPLCFSRRKSCSLGTAGSCTLPDFAALIHCLLLALSPSCSCFCSLSRRWVALGHRRSLLDAGPHCATWQPSLACWLPPQGFQWPFQLFVFFFFIFLKL